jgi:HK97 family phage major capsid protein
VSNAIRERLERAADGLRQFADEVDAKSGGATGEDQNELLRRASEIRDLKKQYDASKDASNALGEVSSFLKDLSDAPQGVVKDINDPRLTKGFDPKVDPFNPAGSTKSLGDMWTESAAYKSFLDTYSVGGDIPNSRKGIQSAPMVVDSKALITGASSTSAGAAVFNDRYPGITDLVGYRELTVADLVTRGTTTSDAIDYVTVTARTNNAGMHAETTNVTSSAIKAESSMELAVATANVRTIAHWIPITRRAAADASQVRTLVDAFLRYGLEEELEDQIIGGAGTGENFTGILNVSNIQSQDATVGGGGNVFDSIALAISKIRYTGFRRPTGIVMNPLDWYSTDALLKKEGTSLNSYVFGDPGGSFEQNQRLWGLPVVVTPAITQNTALVGDFRQAVLWEREGVTTYMTDSHSDFFVRNVLVILAEMRAAFTVLDPRAFCKVTNV